MRQVQVGGGGGAESCVRVINVCQSICRCDSPGKGVKVV